MLSFARPHRSTHSRHPTVPFRVVPGLLAYHSVLIDSRAPCVSDGMPTALRHCGDNSLHPLIHEWWEENINTTSPTIAIWAP